MHDEDDDGRPDTTLLSNPWFYVFVAVYVAVWAVVLWAALS